MSHGFQNHLKFFVILLLIWIGSNFLRAGVVSKYSLWVNFKMLEAIRKCDQLSNLENDPLKA